MNSLFSLNIPFRHYISRVFFGLSLSLATSAFGHGEEEHGNHDAKHGGFVMMYLEMHFELVLPEGGGIQLYYSDPMRMDLPAAVVSDVAVEIERGGNQIEPVTMQISDSGDHWTGTSSPVVSPETIVRVAFMFQGEPFVLDIPAAVFPALSEHANHSLVQLTKDASVDH